MREVVTCVGVSFVDSNMEDIGSIVNFLCLTLLRSFHEQQIWSIKIDKRPFAMLRVSDIDTIQGIRGWLLVER